MAEINKSSNIFRHHHQICIRAS